MNQYLKKLGEIAELNVQTKVVRYYDGRRDEQYFPFHQVLTTHIARKSYITNSLILGIPERVVREVSGHKDEKSFRRYIKLAESYKSQVIQKAFSKENIEKALN
jgi:integrase